VSSAEACFDILGAAPRGASYDHLYDRLGSTRQLLDSNQATTDTYSYYAFGEVRTSSGSTTNPFKFVGRLGYYDDPSTDFQYLRARYYAPGLGRFWTVDPAGGGLPLYVYVEDDPALSTDPSGRFVFHNCPADIEHSMELFVKVFLKRRMNQFKTCLQNAGINLDFGCLSDAVNQAKHTHVYCDKWPQGHCRAGGYCSYVVGYDIHICPAAWRSPRCQGENCSLAHELVHRCGFFGHAGGAVQTCLYCTFGCRY